MKTVDELVSEWTEEEREKLKDLIRECRERETRLTENSYKWKQSLSTLAESLISLSSNLCRIERRTARLADDLMEIYLRGFKKRMPSA